VCGSLCIQNDLRHLDGRPLQVVSNRFWRTWMCLPNCRFVRPTTTLGPWVLGVVCDNQPSLNYAHVFIGVRLWSFSATFITEVSMGNTNLFFIFFISVLFNSLPQRVKPRPARCYSGALTTRGPFEF